jgi:putative N-acetylmannosamine-6-phosphate epimerase
VFDSVLRICDYAKTAEACGAVAVKIEGIERIEAVKEVVSIPVIGIVKMRLNRVPRFPITVTKEQLDRIFAAGGDYAATESLAVVESADDYHRSKIIFEADAFETSKIAESFGVAAIATTLFGYTPETHDRFSLDPDIAAIEELAKVLSTPLIAEGRYGTAADIEEAIRAGAFSVCIGTAVTRPDVVIQRFVSQFEHETTLHN